MFVVSVYFNLPLQGIVLFTGLGHIFDILLPKMVFNIKHKNDYQKISEKFIYLLAFYNNYLGLGCSESFKTIKNQCNIKASDLKNVELLFKFYATELLKKSSSQVINKSIDQYLSDLNKQKDFKYRFFLIIEQMFNDQIDQASPEDIEYLKNIALDFNVNYSRNYSYSYTPNDDYQDNESENYDEYEYFEQEPVIATIDQEVIDSFENLGFSIDNIPALADVKKRYRQIAKKYHPDTQTGDYNLQENQKKLAEINRSMDIIKKFLANS